MNVGRARLRRTIDARHVHHSRVNDRTEPGRTNADGHASMNEPGVIRKLSLRLLIAAALPAVYAGSACAGGFALYEIGTADVGLAAAGYAARAQDPATVLTNPAGMTRLEGTQVLLGAQLLYGDAGLSLGSTP